MENFAPYARKFSEVLGNLASRIEPEVHPLLVKREKISKVELLHFTADRGLCGSFNVNSINRGEQVDQGAEHCRQRTHSDPGGKKGERLLQERKIQYPGELHTDSTEPLTFPLSTR